MSYLVKKYKILISNINFDTVKINITLKLTKLQLAQNDL